MGGQSQPNGRNNGGQNRLRQGTGTKAAAALYRNGFESTNIWNGDSLTKPRIQFRLRISKGDDIAVGPGKINLLEAIGTTGSITAATRSLGI
jgi:hypothetical protein